MKQFLKFKKKMSQKLKKIKCNLTGKILQIYNDYYDKKVAQYNGEENLQKYYIQNKIITLIKSGHSIDSIAQLFGFEIHKENIKYYNELIEFHRSKNLSVAIKDSSTSFMETDPLVKNFINNWLEYVNSLHSSSFQRT